MTDGFVLVRKTAVIDLIAVARDAADVLCDRGADPREMACASALRGSAGEVAADIAEPAFQ